MKVCHVGSREDEVVLLSWVKKIRGQSAQLFQKSKKIKNGQPENIVKG